MTTRTASRTRSGQPLAAPPGECRRQTPFALRSGEGQESDGLTLDGYAAVFNRDTVIDSWEGKFRERIAPGAMKKSFRENPPKIQFDHGQHPMIGSIPIARLQTIEEASDPDLAPEGGAHVVGRLFDNWLVQPVRDAIAEGAVNGMSFRFSVVRERWADQDGKIVRDGKALAEYMDRSWYEDLPEEELWTRTLLELRVPELGPVTWPAYGDTSVSVRSTVTFDAKRIMEDPDARRELARFVWLADQAEARQNSDTGTDDAPHHTVEAQPPAVEHAAAPPATPLATDRPAEHLDPSPAAPSQTRAQRDLAVWVRKSRDVVLSLPD